MNNDMIVKAIEAGNTEELKRIIASARDYHDAEDAVNAILENNASEDILELALQNFLDCAQTGKPLHGYWVHSLSHFTEYLWEKRMTGWITIFNVCAFQGAIRFNDSNCSDRLLGDFAKFAQWDDSPADFGLTAENLTWVDWSGDWMQEIKTRIDAAPYKSEADYLISTLGKKENQRAKNKECEMGLVDAEGINALLARIAELGGDITPYATFIADLQRAQIAELKQSLVDYPDHWNTSGIKRGIEILTQALTK